MKKGSGNYNNTLKTARIPAKSERVSISFLKDALLVLFSTILPQIYANKTAGIQKNPNFMMLQCSFPEKQKSINVIKSITMR